MAKITGFNDREQRLFDVLSDGKYHTIADLKKLFVRISKTHLVEKYEEWDESDQDPQAQSFVRNGLRRLVRDGWVDGPHTNDSLPRGTYVLSRTGKDRLKRGVTETPSAKSASTSRKKKAKAEPKKTKPADASLLKGVEKATSKQLAKEKAQAARKRANAAAKREATAEKKASNGKKAPSKKKATPKPKKKGMLGKALEEIQQSVGAPDRKSRKAAARARAQAAAKKAAAPEAAAAAK